MDKIAWVPGKVLPDYDISINQSYVQPTSDGFSVFNLSDKSYLMTFKDEATARDFAKQYDAANMRRRGVSKVYMRFLPQSEDRFDKIDPQSKILKMPSQHEVEQQKRDEILAPQTFEEKREKFKKLRNEGLPHVPELKQELDQFRMQPARPHGQELPAPPGVPELSTVEEIMREKERRAPNSMPKSRVASWLIGTCRFAS